MKCFMLYQFANVLFFGYNNTCKLRILRMLEPSFYCSIVKYPIEIILSVYSDEIYEDEVFMSGTNRCFTVMVYACHDVD